MHNDWHLLVRFLFKRKALDLILLWIWEFPQTIAGIISIVVLGLTGRIIQMGIAENVLVVVCEKRWGAISLGEIIIGDVNIAPSVDNQLFKHEFGHAIQSKKVGIFYLLIFGLPSLFSALFKKERHQFSLVEKNANKLAHRFFNEKYASSKWDFENYPIT